MNVLISSRDYDYHTLLKVAEMAGLAGIVGFHAAGDDYLLTFPDGEDTPRLVEDYKARLKAGSGSARRGRSFLRRAAAGQPTSVRRRRR